MKNNSLIQEWTQYPQGHPLRHSAEMVVDHYYVDTYIQNGVIRWKQTNRVPPQEVLEFWKFLGFEFDMEKSVKARTKDTKSVIKHYRKSMLNKVYTLEDYYEMQAAFGRNRDVVDIILGKKI